MLAFGFAGYSSNPPVRLRAQKDHIRVRGIRVNSWNPQFVLKWNIPIEVFGKNFRHMPRKCLTEFHKSFIFM